VKVRVLGCSGGELGVHRTTCFLLGGTVAIDAGALTASLPLDALEALDDIVLTHSHFDHVKDVPLLADLLVGRRERPVLVHASEECAKTLKRHVFNDRLWPDFTRIPSRKAPVVELRPFAPGRAFRVGGFTFRPIRMEHTVESTGFLVRDGDGAIAISGDTGPTRAFWKAARAAPSLRAVLVETSFPNRMQGVADASGHLTPRTLAGELRKLGRNDVPILLYHLKPAYAAELAAEVAALHPRARILATGDELDL
jgi:ribonuclease BN (tRNA processing enzyme)